MHHTADIYKIYTDVRNSSRPTKVLIPPTTQKEPLLASDDKSTCCLLSGASDQSVNCTERSWSEEYRSRCSLFVAQRSRHPRASRRTGRPHYRQIDRHAHHASKQDGVGDAGTTLGPHVTPRPVHNAVAMRPSVATLTRARAGATDAMHKR